MRNYIRDSDIESPTKLFWTLSTTILLKTSLWWHFSTFPKCLLRTLVVACVCYTERKIRTIHLSSNKSFESHQLSPQIVRGTKAPFFPVINMEDINSSSLIYKLTFRFDINEKKSSEFGRVLHNLIFFCLNSKFAFLETGDFQSSFYSLLCFAFLFHLEQKPDFADFGFWWECIRTRIV